MGGQPVAAGAHPYVVKIESGEDRMNKCTGVLINARWVLTAKDCFGAANTGFALVGGKERKIVSVERHTERNREDECQQADGHGQWKSLADQLGDAIVLVLERRPEVAAQEPGDVAAVLHPHRLVEAVLRLEVRRDLGRHCLLLVERPARCKPHHEERRGDDDQQRRHHAQQPAQRVSRHVS